MPRNYFRLRLSPEVVISEGALVKRNGEQMHGYPVELVARHHSETEKSPYERLLGDAIRGDTSLFTQDDCVEAAWRVVDPVLTAGARCWNTSPALGGPPAAAQVVNDGGCVARPGSREIRAVLNTGEVIFLLDVDNTLLDNDRFAADLGERLEQAFGAPNASATGRSSADCASSSASPTTWEACRCFRSGLDDHPDLLAMSEFLLEYPFTARLFPQALEAVAHLRSLGRPVVLSDGDIVFQPRKIQRSGIWDAVEGRVMIYLHKERVLDHVQQRYPSESLCHGRRQAELAGGDEIDA